MMITIIILGMMTTVAMFVSRIMLREARINLDMGDAMEAFYAAETAVEQTLFQARQEPTPDPIPPAFVSVFLDTHGDSSYATTSIDFVAIDVGISTRSARIRANGRYHDTYRAIEVTQPVY